MKFSLNFHDNLGRALLSRWSSRSAKKLGESRELKFKPRSDSTLAPTWFHITAKKGISGSGWNNQLTSQGLVFLTMFPFVAGLCGALICITHFLFSASPRTMYYDHPHFSDRETKAQEVGKRCINESSHQLLHSQPLSNAVFPMRD